MGEYVKFKGTSGVAKHMSEYRYAVGEYVQFQGNSIFFRGSNAYFGVAKHISEWQSIFRSIGTLWVSMYNFR